MNWNLGYEIARQRMAERQQTAREAAKARTLRAARKRQAKGEAPDAVSLPAIPDFAYEMFEAARDTAPARETLGRHARSGR